MIRIKKQPKSREQEDEALQLWWPVTVPVSASSSTILNTEKGHDGPLLETETSSVLGAIPSDWMFIHCFHL